LIFVRNPVFSPPQPGRGAHRRRDGAQKFDGDCGEPPSGRSALLRGTLVEFPALALAAVLPAAGALLTAALPLLLLLAAARHGAGAAKIGIRPALAVAGGEHDLQLVQLVPLGIGTLPVGNRLKLLQPGARGYWF
jgi:hypothetical protein